jgi:hypothetical protein
VSNAFGVVATVQGGAVSLAVTTPTQLLTLRPLLGALASLQAPRPRLRLLMGVSEPDSGM